MARPLGAKNSRTLQWEALCDSLTGELAENFQEIMTSWARSGDFEQEMAFVAAYTKILEYHKPKLQRTALSNEGDRPLVTIVIPEKL